MNEEFPDETAFDEEAHRRALKACSLRARYDEGHEERTALVLVTPNESSRMIAELLNRLQPRYDVVVDPRSETKLPSIPDLASIAEEYTDMKNTRMVAMLGHAMATALLMGRSAIGGGGHVEAKSKRGRQLSSHGHYTYTKPNGPTGPGMQRLKQKAKGVATAKARGCYRSAKKK